MQWEQELARQSTMEDPCESVLIRVPLLLCALCVSAVKNPFQAAKDLHVSNMDLCESVSSKIKDNGVIVLVVVGTPIKFK